MSSPKDFDDPDYSDGHDLGLDRDPAESSANEHDAERGYLEWERRGFTDEVVPEFRDATDPVEVADPKAELTRKTKPENLERNRNRKRNTRAKKQKASPRILESRQKEFENVRRVVKRIRLFRDEERIFTIEGKVYLEKVKSVLAIIDSYPHDRPEFLIALGRYLTDHKPGLIKNKLYQGFLNHCGLDPATAGNATRMWNALGDNLKHFKDVPQGKLLIITRHIEHMAVTGSKEEAVSRVLAQLKNIKGKWTLEELRNQFPDKEPPKGAPEPKAEEAKEDDRKSQSRISVIENRDGSSLTIRWRKRSADFRKRLAQYIREALLDFPSDT